MILCRNVQCALQSFCTPCWWDVLKHEWGINIYVANPTHFTMLAHLHREYSPLFSNPSRNEFIVESLLLYLSAAHPPNAQAPSVETKPRRIVLAATGDNGTHDLGRQCDILGTRRKKFEKASDHGEGHELGWRCRFSP